jgi:hypothetical protein
LPIYICPRKESPCGHDDPPQASQGDKDGQASAKVIEPPEGWNVMKDPDNFYLKNPDNLRMRPAC